jgi:hypothetical protein
MLHLSQLIIANQEIDSFDALLAEVADAARDGERFLRFDVKPPYPDTPEDWEERIESVFSGRL